MQTAEIGYRVADFLRQYPPFTAIADEDLLALAANGRVRFHEPGEYLLWQGEPHRHHVFVIHQGTVSLWDDRGEQPVLRDVRGAGDMLGLERYEDQPETAYSARSESDVLIYSFPHEDFRAFVLKYPHAVQFVAGEGRIAPDYQGTPGRRDLHRLFLAAQAGSREIAISAPEASVASVAQQLMASDNDVAAITGSVDGLKGIVTARDLTRWAADGGGEAHVTPIGNLELSMPALVGPQATVADALLAMCRAGQPAAAMTADGTPAGRLHAIVSAAELTALYRDQPLDILRAIRRATRVEQLAALTNRGRAFIADHLTNAGAVEWLSRLVHVFDSAVVRRLVELDAPGRPDECWCFVDGGGRQELLAPVAPTIVVLAGHQDLHGAREACDRVVARLSECGYVDAGLLSDSAWRVASVDEWQRRYAGWIAEPVQHEVYRGRAFFDIRPVLGSPRLLGDVAAVIEGNVGDSFLHVLANDCLASLPPLAFYDDQVVDSVGDHEAIFRLEETALRPIVDVARVFALASGAALGLSTVERLDAARAFLPGYDAIFREAADAFRVVLWQQGRVGISQQTSGAELPPNLLSRHDRHVLKGGFRSIRALLEFTAAREWLSQ